jgi:hypothetical protein
LKKGNLLRVADKGLGTFSQKKKEKLQTDEGLKWSDSFDFPVASVPVQGKKITLDKTSKLLLHNFACIFMQHHHHILVI